MFQDMEKNRYISIFTVLTANSQDAEALWKACIQYGIEHGALATDVAEAVKRCLYLGIETQIILRWLTIGDFDLSILEYLQRYKNDISYKKMLQKELYSTSEELKAVSDPSLRGRLRLLGWSICNLLKAVIREICRGKK